MQLRAATADSHQRVDRLLSQFDFADMASYRRVLRTFGRVVPNLEADLSGQDVWTGWRPRAPLIADDLAKIGEAIPKALSSTWPSLRKSPWAIQYVLEGSRLGGRVLAGRVPAGLPATYFSASMESKDWRQFQVELQAVADRHGAVWIDTAIGVAIMAFKRFELAAEGELNLVG